LALVIPYIAKKQNIHKAGIMASLFSTPSLIFPSAGKQQNLNPRPKNLLLFQKESKYSCLSKLLSKP